MNGGVASDAIHCLSVTGQATINDRLMEWPVPHRQLLAANSQIVVQVDGGNVDGSNEVMVFDIASTSTRSLGTLSSLSIGDPGPVGAVLSPDGALLAIGGGHKLLLIDLKSRDSRTLATIPADQSRFFMPIRWTAAGILTEKVPYEGMGDFGLLMIDPSSGAISTINQGPNNQLVMSRNGNSFASTTHVDLGDGPSVRFPWQNAISLRVKGGSETRITSQRDHWFMPLDVTDDGQLLFASDSQTDPVVPDMGVYVAKDGVTTQQLTSTFSGEWGPGRFLDPSRAFVTHFQGGVGDKETSVDLELYQLCPHAATACTSNRTTVITFPGTWPTVITSVIVLPAASPALVAIQM